MAVYQYIDTDGKQQEVTVQWVAGECKKKQFVRGGRRTSVTQIWEATSYIQLSKPLPATLTVNAIKIEAVALKNLTQQTIETPVVFLIPRGTIKHQITHHCRYDYVSDDARRKSSVFTYRIEEQENVPDNPEIFEPIRQEDLKFKEAADYFSTFTESQTGLDKDFEWRVEIRKRAGSGITTARGGRNARPERGAFVNTNSGSKEICLSGTPIEFEQRSKKKGDPYEPLVPMALTLNMWAFEEGELEEIGSAGDAELRIDIYRGNKLYVQGYNIASEYTESYKSPPYAVSIDFGCGLALLQKIPFEIDEETPRKSAFEIIRKCLGRLNSELSIMSAIYTYPAEMPRNLNIDPYAACELDERVYQDSKGIYTCGKVLEEILRKDKAQIFISQRLGEVFWFIRETNAMIDDLPYRFYVYNGPGNIKRLPPEKLVIQHDGVNQPYQINADASEKKKKETYREVIVNRKLDYIPQLFPGGEFDNMYGRGEIEDWNRFGAPITRQGTFGGRQIKTGRGGYATVDGNYSLIMEPVGRSLDFILDGNTYQDENGITSKGVKVHVENGNTFSVYLQLKFVINLPQNIIDYYNKPDNPSQTNSALPIQIKIGDKYLNEDKTWSSEPYTILVFSNMYNTWFSFALENIPVPDDANLQISIFRPNMPGPLANSIDDQGNQGAYVEIDFVRGQYLPEGDFATTSNTLYATNILSRSNSDPYEETIIHADVDTLQNISAITYQGKLTTTWQRYYADGEALPLGELSAKKILDNYTNTDSWRLNNFSVIENNSGLNFASVVTTAEMPDKRFICTSWRYTPVSPQVCGVMTCDWIEVNNANVVPRFEYDRGEGTYGSAGGGGGGGGGNFIMPEQNTFDILEYLTPQDITNPYWVGMKNGKLAIDLKELRDEFEPDPQSLDVTTKTGNISERDILIGPLTAPSNERTAYTRYGIYAQSNKLELSSNVAIRFLGPALVAEIKNSNFYHYDVNVATFTANKLIAKDTNGKTRGIAPSELISAGKDLTWNGNTINFTGVIPEAFDKDYNSLKNRPFTNYSGYITANNYVRLGFSRVTGTFSRLLGIDSNNEIIKGTASEWDIATQNYVTTRGYATETWVRNYVGSQTGNDTNYYTYRVALESDGRIKIDVSGYGSVYTGSLDNRYLRRSEYDPNIGGNADGNSYVTGLGWDGRIILYQSEGKGTKYSINFYDIFALKGDTGGDGGYVLPTASSLTKGGVKIQGYNAFYMSGDDLKLKLGPGLGINNSGQLYNTYSDGGGGSGATNTYFKFNSGNPYIQQSPGSNVYLDVNLYDYFEKKGAGLSASVGKMGAGSTVSITGTSFTTFHTVSFPAGYITGYFIVECYRESQNTATLIDVAVKTGTTTIYSLFSFNEGLGSVYSQRTTVPFILNSSDSRTVTAQYRMWIGHNGVTQQIKVLGIHYMKLD